MNKNYKRINKVWVKGILFILLLILLLPCPLLAQESDEEEKPPSFEEVEQTFRPLSVSGGLTEELIEIEVNRWGDVLSDDTEREQEFTVSITNQPSFLTNATLLGGSELTFKEDESQKVIQLQFGTAERGAFQEGAEEELIILIKADDSAIMPEERRLIIPLKYNPLAAANIHVCVKQAGLEDSPEPEDAHNFCDDQLEKPYIYDGLWLFFTPERDLSKAFRWQVVHEGGKSITGGIYDPDHEDFNSTDSAGEGAPGKFVRRISAWDFFEGESDDPLPVESIGYGKYTVQTCDPELSQAGVFGQFSGWTQDCSGDWQDEGSFELHAARLHLQGFGTEQGSLPFSGYGIYEGKGIFGIESKEVQGDKATIIISAEWEEFHDDTSEQEGVIAEYAGTLIAKRGERGDNNQRAFGEVTRVDGDLIMLYDGPTCLACRVPTLKVGENTMWDPEGDFTSLGSIRNEVKEYRSVVVKKVIDASSRVTLQFPEIIDPQAEIMGDIRAEIATPDPDLLFWAELHRLVPSETGPPDRSMILPDNEREYYFGYIHPADVDDPDDPWYIGGEEIDGLLSGPEGSRDFHIHHGFRDMVTGKAKQLFSRQIRKEGVKWFIPVWFGLDPKTKIAGFAVYGTEPGVYDGPWPDLPGAVGDDGDDGDDDDDDDDDSGTGEDEVTGVDDNGDGVDADGDGTGAGGGDMSGDRVRTGPVDPESLDPDSDDVALNIRQWLSVAEPPENAVEGGSWSYDKFGRKVGGGAGVRVVSTHNTVDYGGGTPEATAWSIRKKLDSIDHCTLEEYVAAKLNDEPVSDCAGRYGAVKDLKGADLNEAKTVITNKGFTAALAPGSPAKTPEDEGTIEKQEPGPEQHLKKGDTVKLFVHSPYVPPGKVLPSLTGKTLQEAKNWLQENGFKVKLKPGSPAPSAELSGSIEEQEPAAGSRAEKGSKVAIKIYSPYIADNVDRGVPEMQCPPTVTMVSSDFLDPQERGAAPPNGSQVPLDRTKSAYDRLPDGRNVFYCNYTLVPGQTQTFVQVLWADEGSEGSSWGCKDESDFMGRFNTFYSPDKRAQASAFGSAFDLDRSSAEAKNMIRQVEPYAQSCYGQPGEQRMKVPDVTGIVVGSAKKKLLDAGYKVKILPGPPAPTAETSGMVKSQQPAAGTGVVKGGQVSLSIYSPFIVQNSDVTGASRWVLSETLINPAGKPTEFIVGVTPNYYSPRMNGSYDKYYVNKTGITRKYHWVDHGREVVDSTMASHFAPPPPVILPGQRVDLKVSVSGSGVVKEGAVGLQFEYRAKGVSLQGRTQVSTGSNASPPFRTESISPYFTAPKIRKGHKGEISISAFWWNCGACKVTWVYKAQEGNRADTQSSDRQSASPSDETVLVDRAMSTKSSFPGGDEYDRAEVSMHVDPARTLWIGWNDTKGVNRMDGSAGGPFLWGGGGLGSDDFIRVTVTAPDGRRASVDMDINDAWGAHDRSDPMNLIYGTAGDAPDALRIDAFGSTAGKRVVFKQGGAFNNLFVIPGRYKFEFSFRNQHGYDAGHSDIYLIKKGR